jgi:hypothetical protein
VALVEVEVTATTVELHFEDTATTFEVEIPIAAALPYEYNAEVDDRIIRLVVGNGLTAVAAWGVGVYEFNTKIEIESALISVADTKGVTQIMAISGEVEDGITSGVVSLIEGYNCILNVISSLNQISIGAAYGKGAGVYCGTYETPVIAACNAILQRINGLHGDSNGNFNLFGSNSIKVSAEDANTLVVERSLDNDTISCG